MKVVITDYQFDDVEQERELIEGAGFELEAHKSARTEEELIPLLRDADAVITQYSEITANIIAHMEHCKMIIKYGIGVNNIDCKAAGEKGIYVCNVPDYGIDEVSDHTVAMILALGRKLTTFRESMRNGEWGYMRVVPLLRLSECTAGLIGFGRIPQMVAKKLQAFGMKILAYDPYVDPKVMADAGVTPITSVKEMCEKVDFLSVHCPLTEGTRHIIGREELRSMKPTAVVINTARGGIIDEKALIEALQEGWISGAGVDVYEEEPVAQDNPLLHMNNVFTTPHNAFYSETAVRLLQRKPAEEVVNVLQGNPPFHCVNLHQMK